MAIWKIEPTWKKSIVERSFYVKDGKTIVNEIGWRWGEFKVETPDDEPPVLDEDTDLYCNDSFELIDFSTSDGCWEENKFEGDWAEGEQEELEQRLEDGEISLWDLENEGWSTIDSEQYITCDVTITKINDDGTETVMESESEEDVPSAGLKLEPKAPWPF